MFSGILVNRVSRTLGSYWVLVVVQSFRTNLAIEVPICDRSLAALKTYPEITLLAIKRFK